MPGAVVSNVVATGLCAAWQRDGGDGMTRDETAWTWWTFPAAIAGCFARRYAFAQRSLAVRTGLDATPAHSGSDKRVWRCHYSAGPSADARALSRADRRIRAAERSLGRPCDDAQMRLFWIQRGHSASAAVFVCTYRPRSAGGRRGVPRRAGPVAYCAIPSPKDQSGNRSRGW